MTSDAVVWIVVAVLLAVLEAGTLQLVSVWFCIGAVAAAITATQTGSLITQGLVFVCVAAVLLVLTRPLVKRYLQPRIVSTNADRIIGQTGIVIVAIDPVRKEGQVQIGRQIWSAKSADETPLAVDTLVRVTAIEGVRAVVVPSAAWQQDETE